MLRKRIRDVDGAVPGNVVITWFSISIRKILARLLRQKIPHFSPADGVNCLVTFDVSGSDVELAVPWSIYYDLEEKTEGLLVYQADRFICFIPVGQDH